jgi:hypothetical protein
MFRLGISNSPLRCIFLFFLMVFITSCSTGNMTIKETHYYYATNGKDKNYYRLRVVADTYLGVAGYRSGWFPADAVDYAFGDVSATSGTEALKTRNAIKDQINEKIISTNQAWLNAASDPDKDIVTLKKLQEARRRILAYPMSDGTPFDGAFEIEYNPSKSVNIRFSDDKLIFVLASDPDTIVANIASFGESQESALAIDSLAKVISDRSRTDIVTAEAVNEARQGNDSLVSGQIDMALKVAQENDSRIPKVIDEINTLLILLEGVNP